MAEALEVWPINSDAKVLITGISDDQGNYINNATIVGVMKDANGIEIVNADNIAFTLVPDSNGDYVGIVPHNADLLNGRKFTLEITITSGTIQCVILVTRIAKYDTI